jgi:hypothetical protein
MSSNPTRRSFFSSVAAGGAVFAAGSAAHAARAPFRRKSRSSVEMIEVGILMSGGYNHINRMWNVYLNPPTEPTERGVWPRSLGMVATMCWDPNPEFAREWADRHDVKTVDHYADMVGKVDAVIMADYEATGWNPQLTKPYIEAGIPILINRPFSLSVNDAVEMLELSKQHNTPIFVPSPFESREEVVRQKNNLRQLQDEGAHILSAFQNTSATEYAAHGCHGIYNIHQVLEPDVLEVGFKTDNEWREFKSAMMTLRCAQESGPDYFVAVQMGPAHRSMGSQMIITSQGRLFEHYDRSGGVYEQLRWHNYPSLFNFAAMVETRKMPQTHDHILAKTKTFLAGFYSTLEKDGGMVRVADLPPDWRAPDWNPDRFTGIRFD